VPSRDPPPFVWVSKDDRRASRAFVRKSCRIVLPRALPVTVEVRVEKGVLPPGRILSARIAGRPAGGRGPPREFASPDIPLSRSGQWHFTVPAPDTYRFEIEVFDGRRSKIVRGVAPRSIEVASTATPARLGITVDAGFAQDLDDAFRNH
jgi:hypothetical protein